MDKNIVINGIETNNLKNIDITLTKKSLNLIVGPSGSGKSSLAYSTICDIGLQEYMSMFCDEDRRAVYKVREYFNMAPTVPLSQSNHNHNVRSTIGTYFGVNSKLAILFSSILQLEEGLFVLNKEANTCACCHGTGCVSELDILKVIDFNKPLKSNPFRCWQRYSDFYSKIIMKFCEENGIDWEKCFGELSEQEQSLLLRGESENKFQIRFKHGSSFSNRTIKYYGILTNQPMRKNFTPPSSYYSDVICPHCMGMKFSKKHSNYTLCGKSIGEVMLTPFCELETYLTRLKSQNTDGLLSPIIDVCYNFISKANELNLGHLYLNRSIPSLSGGELQRLRLVHVFNSQLSDLIIVLDEPVAGLSKNEKNKVFHHILGLLKNHTLVLVDHSALFIPHADTIIALGPGGGRHGGEIIDTDAYLRSQILGANDTSSTIDHFIRVRIPWEIYAYKGVQVDIAENCTNIITGPSGIGKSTLIREYFSRYFDDYTYINQKQISGNQNSCVATLLSIATPIFDMFSSEFGKEKHFFSNASGKPGCCQMCSGAGVIQYGATVLTCGECDGSGFRKELQKYKIQDKSISDIWGMTIDEGIHYFERVSPKIAHRLKVACELALSHLMIGQPTTSLSGGENVRIKLLRLENKTATVLGVDEPFKGLNPSEISLVIKYLNKLRDRKKTIIVVDHSEIAIPYFDYHIEIGIKEDQLIEMKDLLR